MEHLSDFATGNIFVNTFGDDMCYGNILLTSHRGGGCPYQFGICERYQSDALCVKLAIDKCNECYRHFTKLKRSEMLDGWNS